jgi:hypothetical protein
VLVLVLVAEAVRSGSVILRRASSPTASARHLRTRGSLRITHNKFLARLVR